MRPYIGITGLVSKADTMFCLKHVPKNPMRQLMVGVLLSSKTINGGQNKYPVRYPHYKSISEIFVNDERCLNMIHYVTDNKKTLVQQLCDAAEIGGANCHGFQLNIVWPEISDLMEAKRLLPNHKFVIQCSSSAMRSIEDSLNFNTALNLKHMVDIYKDAKVIDYLLIDPSGGRGISFNAPKCIALLKPHLNQSNYGIGVAGGLKAQTIHNLIPVLTEIPQLMWDAEGGLRDEEDHLDWSEVERYLVASFGLDELEKRGQK
jgi:hypothetical protein